MVFDSRGKRFASNNNNPENNEDPFHHNNFVMSFDNIESNKRNIYKNLKNKAGVYLFKNKITNDLYVGSSINLSKRMAVHFYNANSKKDTNIILYRAMKKYKLQHYFGCLQFY
jgi:GIY-YIG catalytic domain